MNNIEQLQLAMEYEDLLNAHEVIRMGFNNFFNIKNIKNIDYPLYTIFKFFECKWIRDQKFIFTTDEVNSNCNYIFIRIY